jgi:hypothetical protein
MASRHPLGIINKINNAYNPENDYDRDAPPVPWHVAELVDAVQWLYEENQHLRERIDNLTTRLDEHEAGGYLNTI